MSDFLQPKDPFLLKAIGVVEEHLSEEEFGVTELANQLSMSRSNLLRKIKSLTNLSASVFIRKVRLHHARRLLQSNELTSSEVSYKVGFGSTSYFTKCYREEFGTTPAKQQPDKENVDENGSNASKKRKWIYFAVPSLIILLVLVWILHPGVASQKEFKSIAVLPFKNDSNDTTNVYIINGVMDAILSNLQKIEELKVTSRTTAEKYRGLNKSIPEISKELEVEYFVEGSGQKVGDRIVLSVQLIDAEKDQQIWSSRFERKNEDIFELQSEISKTIADQIQVIITPKAKRLIEKVPTESLEAYDLFLKGLDITNKANGGAELEKAIDYFKKAIDEDPYFANPHAYIAICYYYIDIYQVDKKYGNTINSYADKAILLDPELGEGLIAKAMYHTQNGQYDLAIEFLDKVLNLNPNSGWVHNFLSEIYRNNIPNTEKYLKHAIRGIQNAISDQDSIEASFTYLHLANALAQTGFIKESVKYVKQALAYNPENYFAEYLYIYIKMAQDLNLKQTKNELIDILEKDSSRIDVMQEIAKLCYTMEDYEEAWKYYEAFISIKQALQLDIYPAEDLKIAYVLRKLGQPDEAERFLNAYKAYIDSDNSIYKDLSTSAYYAYEGDINEGIKYFKAFTKQTDYFYWLILFLEIDPILLEMSQHDDFQPTVQKIKDNFWEQHQEIREMLEEEGVI
ncbi:TolB amino-terminal domain-containing protein [Ekhidna lutea]|uniref:TolB amino-terminal domain-containing protein n=1 Tax=Ekhidna lutea TaxID=447679 RepID=A0A239HUM8_EKHLU|nr:helix-turn-helix domain-containing protein [Ekhidna lutea]SNS84981.1 TolB amino-terminal domain-containing protein [Ekhidna lutea]